MGAGTMTTTDAKRSDEPFLPWPSSIPNAVVHFPVLVGEFKSLGPSKPDELADGSFVYLAQGTSDRLGRATTGKNIIASR